jgi:hypothetical protein
METTVLLGCVFVHHDRFYVLAVDLLSASRVGMAVAAASSVCSKLPG